MSPKNALTNLIELASNVTDAYTTALYAADLEQGTLTLRSHLTLSSHLKTDAAFAIGEGLLGQAALRKEIRVDDFAGLETPDLEWYTQPEAIKGLMVVPVVRRELEGVLVVDSKENYSFTPKLQKLVNGFADQMAWYLSLEKKNPNWIDGEPPEFQHMMKWCRFLCEAPHRKALSERFLHIPRNLIQCDAIAVAWFESGGPGRITHSKGWRQSLKSLTVESGVAISGACFESGQPLLVPNTMKQPWIIFSEDESPESFGAIMAAPIANEKRMLGLVVCATHAANGLQQTELNKLTLMTAFTASALGQMNPQPPAELIPKPEEQATPASQYFMPVHVKAFEAEIIKRDTPVSVLSIRIKNGKTLFNGNRQVQADRLLDQIAIHLSDKVKLLKLFIKRSEEGLILLLIGIIEEQACELEDSIQHELSRLPFTLGKTPVEVEFDYGLASSPSDGRDLKQLIEASWTRTRQPRENAHG